MIDLIIGVEYTLQTASLSFIVEGWLFK